MPPHHADTVRFAILAALMAAATPRPGVAQSCSIPREAWSIRHDGDLRMGQQRMLGASTTITLVPKSIPDTGKATLDFEIASGAGRRDTLRDLAGGTARVLTTADGVFSVCWAGWVGPGRVGPIVVSAALKDKEEDK